MPSYSTCYPPFPLRSSDLYAPFPVHVFAVVLESSIEGLTYHLLMLSACHRGRLRHVLTAMGGDVRYLGFWDHTLRYVDSDSGEGRRRSTDQPKTSTARLRHGAQRCGFISVCLGALVDATLVRSSLTMHSPHLAYQR